MQNNELKIGLVLGSGSARGMAHIGVIRALKAIGIEPDIVVGCSVGALVGASYLNNNLEKLEKWALSLDKFLLSKYFDINLSLTGFIKHKKMEEFFDAYVCKAEIEFADLKKPFATVATDLVTGQEIWIKSGNVSDAVWPSMSFPGLYPPFASGNQWLVDGGLVNPVPVSLARSLGADIIIAVNLNSDMLRDNTYQLPNAGREKQDKAKQDKNEKTKQSQTLLTKAKSKLEILSSDWFKFGKDESFKPKSVDVVSSSIKIMQDQLTRTCLVSEPPDVLLSPRLSHIGLLELYKAKEAIKEGEECVERMKEEILYRLNA